MISKQYFGFIFYFNVMHFLALRWHRSRFKTKIEYTKNIEYYSIFREVQDSNAKSLLKKE